jgi:hypothetical protein
MTIIATGLSNEVIGGKYNVKGGIRFRARYSSPFASIRAYDIDHAAGYAGGTGGSIDMQLFTDMNGLLGRLLALGTKTPDPQFPDPSSGKGRFPLICFTPQVTLVAGAWYWIVISDADPNPSVNYYSMDYLTGPPNQVDDIAIYIFADNAWKPVPYLIPSPIQFNCSNGLRWGHGWIGANVGGVKGALESGVQYGFAPETLL